MHEYKILTQKDKKVKGKSSYEILEEEINEYAKEGWSVKSMTIVELKSEIVTLLEREI